MKEIKQTTTSYLQKNNKPSPYYSISRHIALYRETQLVISWLIPTQGEVMSNFYPENNLPQKLPGPYGHRLKDLTGQTFGSLRVIYRISDLQPSHASWLCECLACGRFKAIVGGHLRRKQNPIRSCGCLRVRSGSEHHQWSGAGDISGAWWFRVTRTRNKRKKRVEVHITPQQAWNLFKEQNKRCALSGIELVINNIHKLNTASLDRIDSNGHYEIKNVQWVHKEINIMKNVFSQERFIEMCSRVARHQTLIE